MALFDERPTINKNSFTLPDAGTVFRNAAEQIEKQTLPKEAAEITLTIAKLLLEVGAIVLEHNK